MEPNERSAARALELRRELDAARLSRRELVKLGLIGGGAVLLGGAPSPLRRALAATAPSPPTRPWLEPMPVPGVLTSTGALPGMDLTRHQYGQRFGVGEYYAVEALERPHSFHPDLPPSPIWGYNGKFPGPTIDLRYGQPAMIRVKNGLPSLASHRGFGIPQTITHLHNFHTASESDGGPWDWVDPGGHKDHYYCMRRAGFTDSGTALDKYRDPAAPGGTWWAEGEGGGDLRESLTTLFFHEHRPEFTSANVYKGLVLFVRIFDQQDTGSESSGWRLPSGDYDIPLAFTDKQFDQAGQLTFDQFAVDGFLGDKIAVNGKIQPFFEVKRRKYRFRLLNGGPSRFYRFVLRKGGTNYPFVQLGASGNFLEFPRTLRNLDLWVAERPDIVIDFKQFQPGDRVYLANTLVMREDGRGEDQGKQANPNQVQNQVLEFRVQGGSVTDSPPIPSRFRPLPPINLASVARTRTWKFERKNGQWAVNGQFFDPDFDHQDRFLDNPINTVRRNTSEVWVLESTSNGWDHPLHVHFEEGIAFRQNGTNIPAQRRFRTDVHRLRNVKLEVFMQFRDFPDPEFSGRRGDVGRYVLHCHNMLHEDHAMMATWNIVP